MESATLFQKLKPVCVSLVKNGNQKNLEMFLHKMKDFSTNSIQEQSLFEYALFPFKLMLQQKHLSDNEEILYFDCLSALFSKCTSTVVDCKTVIWIFNTFSIYFTPKDIFNQQSNGGEKNSEAVLSKPSQKSEEQKISTLATLESILNKINLNIIENVYQEIKNLPLVGHVISIILKFIETENNKLLLVKAVLCLHLICGKLFKSKIVADTVSSFFPGIALAMNSFFTTNSNQSTKLITPTLEMFGDVACLVLNDNDMPKSQKLTLENLQFAFKQKKTSVGEEKPAEDNTPNEDTNKGNLAIERDTKWYENTSTHIKTILENILPVVMMHDNVKTRLAVISFVKSLLTTCLIALKNSVPAMLDTLAKFLSDPYEEARQKSRDVLLTSADSLERNGKPLFFRKVLQILYLNKFIFYTRILRALQKAVKY